MHEAFDSNWIAPLGPNVDAFEHEFAEYLGAPNAVALSSGTAALHLALQIVGVGKGDEVMVSTLTFAASVFPIIYLGAHPIFIDSECESWNMDPQILHEALKSKAQKGRLPKAIVVVHIYGQSANLAPISAICEEFGVPMIEDAAEALGAFYDEKFVGTIGRFGIFSFNGNKIITTSGGGMLVCKRSEDATYARKLATQAREDAPHYEHAEVGYNYRMSNILAGIGRGQLRSIENRVEARRRNYDFYRKALSDLAGISFMPEPNWGRSSRWLTVIVIDPIRFGVDREKIRLALEEQNIESRPVWKPMHLQPVFADYERYGGDWASHLFQYGLCLPSGSNMSEVDLNRVVRVIRSQKK